MKEITEAEWRAAKERTDAEAPKVLPANWTEIRIPPTSPMFGGGRAYANRRGLQVLFSCGLWEGHGWWLHVSCTAPGRVPFYAELLDVKDLFVGRERQALQVFPRRSQHISIHPFALHLWASLDPAGDGLPTFGAEGTI